MAKAKQPILRPITVKLLNERKGSKNFRKINGQSGEIYIFRWDADAAAFTYTTDKREVLDDIFNSQGRSMGSYFSPVFVEEQLHEHEVPELAKLALLECGIELPESFDPVTVAGELVAAFDAGREAGRAGQSITTAGALPGEDEKIAALNDDLEKTRALQAHDAADAFKLSEELNVATTRNTELQAKVAQLEKYLDAATAPSPVVNPPPQPPVDNAHVAPGCEKFTGAETPPADSATTATAPAS